MDNIIVLILIGFAIGTAGTLIGAGGGFILMPILLLTQPDMPPDIATAISIAVVAINAISGSIAYARSRRIDYKTGLIFSLATIPGSIAGVFVTKYIPLNIFHIVFGCLLVIVATYLFIKNTKAQHARAVQHQDFKKGKGYVTRTLTDKAGVSYTYSYNLVYGIIISVLVGFLSPLLGIGGGIIHVPAMVQVLQFPVYLATATSHFILAIMSTVSVCVHLYEGNYSSELARNMVIGLGIGIIPGAQLGAFLSHKIKTHVIIRVLAVCLAIVGIRMIL